MVLPQPVCTLNDYQMSQLTPGTAFFVPGRTFQVSELENGVGMMVDLLSNPTGFDQSFDDFFKDMKNQLLADVVFIALKQLNVRFYSKSSKRYLTNYDSLKEDNDVMDLVTTEFRPAEGLSGIQMLNASNLCMPANRTQLKQQIFTVINKQQEQRPSLPSAAQFNCQLIEELYAVGLEEQLEVCGEIAEQVLDDMFDDVAEELQFMFE